MKTLHSGWKIFFEDNKEEYESILKEVYSDSNQIIYPRKKHILKAFSYFPPEEIKLTFLTFASRQASSNCRVSIILDRTSKAGSSLDVAGKVV